MNNLSPEKLSIKQLRLASILLAYILATFSVRGQVYDAVSGFSLTKNPNGPWTYGWSTSLTGSLDVFTEETNSVYYNLNSWTDPASKWPGQPNVTKGYPSGLLLFTPGSGFTHCQFTAPIKGTIILQGTFSGEDSENGGSGANIHILHNGRTITDQGLPGLGGPWSPPIYPIQVAEGDTIDTVVNGAFGSYFDYTVTYMQPEQATSGTYSGLLSGTTGVSGGMKMNIKNTGKFAAVIFYKGERAAFRGSFDNSGNLSTSLKMRGGIELALNLQTYSGGTLLGTVSDGFESFGFDAQDSSRAGPALGLYTFLLRPAPYSPVSVPQGTGFGFMSVKSDGAVSIVGRLADGKSFSLASMVVSGSSVPVYLHSYGTNGALMGVLNFQDLLDLSDWSGVISWTKPQVSSNTPYAWGFSTTLSFIADKFAPDVHGFGPDVSLNFSGADLTSDIYIPTIPIHFENPYLPMDIGNFSGVQFTFLRTADVFFGKFNNPTTHRTDSFIGVFLPKDQEGDGYFFSEGESGSVSFRFGY